MTPFQEKWITSTLAPESITTIVFAKGHLHTIVNEDYKERVFVLEIPNGTFMVSDNKELILYSELYTTYKDACSRIVKLLKITNHTSL